MGDVCQLYGQCRIGNAQGCIIYESRGVAGRTTRWPARRQQVGKESYCVLGSKAGWQ